MRSFTRDHAPPGGVIIQAKKSEIVVVTALDHNVGEACSCNACGCAGRGGRGMPPSTYPASITSNGSKTATDWYTKEMENAGYPVEPYASTIADFMCMTPVSSGAPVVIAAGASALLTIGPARGWLDAFYLKIIGLNPATGLEVDPASYRLTPPQVADCPRPCDVTPMRGGFWRGEGDGCCGCRWRAIIGRNADGEAMTFTITNDGVASASFQAVARGYCNARNLCLS